MIAYYDPDQGTTSSFSGDGYIRLTSGSWIQIVPAEPERPKKKPTPREQSKADKAAMLARCLAMRQMLALRR